MNVYTDYRIARDMSYPVGRDMDNVLEKVKVFAEYIKKLVPEEKNICFLVRGSSGAIIAGILASLLERPCRISHFKKEGEDSHSFGNPINIEDYHIITDDFISSGHTVSNIYLNFLKSCNYEKTKIDMLVVSASVCSMYQKINFLDKVDNIVCGRLSKEFSEHLRLSSSNNVVENDAPEGSW